MGDEATERGLAIGAQSDEAIDRERLEDWFAQNIEDAQPPLEFTRISGGRSNLTYEVRDSAGARWALRRPPLAGAVGEVEDPRTSDRRRRPPPPGGPHTRAGPGDDRPWRLSPRQHDPLGERRGRRGRRLGALHAG